MTGLHCDSFIVLHDKSAAGQRESSKGPSVYCPLSTSLLLLESRCLIFAYGFFCSLPLPPCVPVPDVVFLCSRSILDSLTISAFNSIYILLCCCHECIKGIVLQLRIPKYEASPICGYAVQFSASSSIFFCDFGTNVCPVHAHTTHHDLAAHTLAPGHPHDLEGLN